MINDESCDKMCEEKDRCAVEDSTSWACVQIEVWRSADRSARSPKSPSLIRSTKDIFFLISSNNF